MSAVWKVKEQSTAEGEVRSQEREQERDEQLINGLGL